MATEWEGYLFDQMVTRIALFLKKIITANRNNLTVSHLL